MKRIAFGVVALFAAAALADPQPPAAPAVGRLRGPRRRRRGAAPRVRDVRRAAAKLHPHRQRREHVVRQGRLPLRLEEGGRRRRARGRRGASSGRARTPHRKAVPDDPPEPRRRRGLRRRGAARRRPDVAPVPRGQGRRPRTRCRRTSQAPKRLRLEKRGQVRADVPRRPTGEELKFSGAAVRIAFEEPFYVGIGVCAHDKDAIEKAVFSNVELTAPLPRRRGRRRSTARWKPSRSPRRTGASSTSRRAASRRRTGCATAGR